MEKKKKNFFLLKQRKIYERLDVYPFAFILILLTIIFFFAKMENSIYYFIILGIVCIFQILIFFSKFWFDFMMSRICYFLVNSIEEATDVKVDIYEKDNKRSLITKIIREFDITKIEIEKIIYIYDKDKNEFYRPKYNILKKSKIGKFLQCKSLTKDEINKKRAKFGENKMKIPIPSFFSLYKEHVVTPFFVFQLVCTLLRSFDVYSFYNFISVIMTCIFEIIMVSQRIINLAFLRNMRTPPYYIYVYRDKEWIEIPSNEIIPGDIVSVIDGASVKSIKGEEDKDTKNNLIYQIIKRLKEMKKIEEEKKNIKSINTVLNKYKEKEKLPVACDMLLLSGSVIVNESMLTGESVPQIKDSVTKMGDLRNDILDTKIKHKNLIILAGTKVVKTERNEKYEPLPKNVKIAPPDKGAICLVIKTGFNTTQGKLLRRVIYGQEKTKENNKKESLVLIGILLIISLIASCYVLYEGIKINGFLTYKLLLKCLIIITSIIPADLPIELSLIIYNSFVFFESKRIVCIESFRIPLAGKIDICCFDKTGTLTSDEFIIKGIIDINSYEPELAFDSNEETFSVLLGCNSLLNLDGRPAGDPIDVAMFKEVRGSFDKNEICCKRKTKIVPIRRYIFESDLKRMTVLAKVYSETHQKNHYIRVLCKGAPEIIKTLLKEIPQGYDECYLKWAKDGYRILALAYKDNEKYDYNTKREELEKDLIFCGFAIAESPLKHNVEKYIDELIKANYDVCIITGDHLLTTLKVSKDLKLGPENFSLLKVENNKLNWYSIDNIFIKETKSIEEVKLLSQDYTLGITSNEYNKIKTIKNFSNLYEIMQYIKLFCRVSQTQKDEIIKDLIKSGKSPSMCGDGSNDAGALKIATIGVAMLNIKENKLQKKEPFNLLSFDNETTIDNWDAAAVAPFTSKGDSIKCIKNIFVQGRCALLINLIMYKIFILNSLITIYFESFLGLKGIKFSDNQSIYIGFAISMFFLMLSKAKPLNKLNYYRPPKTIFTLASFLSILWQFIIYISSITLILYLTREKDPLSISYDKNGDERFSPNLINTIMFLFQILNQLIIFVVNYQGEPFMQNILQNSFMMKLIFGIIFIGAIIIFDLYPQLNEGLELVSLPEDNIYKMQIIFIMIVNFFICYIMEKMNNFFISKTKTN